MSAETSHILRLPSSVTAGAFEEPEMPAAPGHLSERSAALWGEVVEQWPLVAHQLRLLEEACVALDRCAQARGAIEADGAFFKDRFGQLKPHPALAVERDARVSAARLFRELSLDITVPDDARVPRVGRSS